MAKKVEYTEGIVEFADLLGFRELLSKKSAAEIASIMDTFREEANPKTGLDRSFDKMFTYSVLSDCFFRAVDLNHPANKRGGTGHFFHEILAMVHLQYRLIHDGYLMRGSMTYGQFCAQKDDHGSALFGPAVARAYELESQTAKSPRIIIDPVLIEKFWSDGLLKGHANSHQEEWNDYIKPMLRQDDGGIWYVDYLAGIHGEFDEEPSGTLDFYQHHKAIIEAKLGEFAAGKGRPLDSIGEKLLWLVQYHNSTMMGQSRKGVLAGEDGPLDLGDFLVSVPDHIAFKSYPPQGL